LSDEYRIQDKFTRISLVAKRAAAQAPNKERIDREASKRLILGAGSKEARVKGNGGVKRKSPAGSEADGQQAGSASTYTHTETKKPKNKKTQKGSKQTKKDMSTMQKDEFAAPLKYSSSPNKGKKE
jgi:phage repressor protein C with HTH and peptisase S24 domain